MKTDETPEASTLGPPDVVFQNVSYSVRASYNVFSRKRKTILHNISGEFRSGELTAIVGPSGSGKTTLLHILAGYKRNGFTGSVLINEIDRFSSPEKSSYIMQEDCLHPLLKVSEIMHICAHLKLGDNHSKNAKKMRVKKILGAIGLDSVSHTLTGNLSGGQRKRLGIALELIDNPPIMFFDEPTSGLDSSSTKQCVAMLRNLARQNRAVICTLHQPAASVLEMFDHLYCLADGRCCYSGDTARVTQFLTATGLECPPYHNPADFLLEIVGGEFGDYNSLLVSNIENGKVHTWRKIMPEWGNPELRWYMYFWGTPPDPRIVDVMIKDQTNETQNVFFGDSPEGWWIGVKSAKFNPRCWSWHRKGTDGDSTVWRLVPDLRDVHPSRGYIRFIMWQPCDKMCFTVGIDDFIVQYHRWIQPWRERHQEKLPLLPGYAAGMLLRLTQQDALSKRKEVARARRALALKTQALFEAERMVAAAKVLASYHKNGDQGDKATPSMPLITNLDKTVSRISLRTETNFNASFFKQFKTLVMRCFICTLRDRFHMYSRLIMHMIIGVLIGTFFFNMGEDAGRVFNNFSLLFFSTIFLAFSALQSTVISFPLEVPIIRREYFNRWYSVGAYYIANTIADLPIQVGCALFYCSAVYWMSGQPRELMRFFMFSFICTIVSLLAQSIGYFVGSSMRVMNGVMFGPLFIMPWVMMSGYFIQKRDAPNWSKPFFTISYLRHGMEGLVASIYGYSRTPLPCLSEDYCHLKSPKKVLKELDMVDIDYTTNVLVIMGMYLFFKTLTYLVLVYQLKIKR